jgi:hypothetical protein
VFLELLDHTIEIGIAGAKAPCKPVPTALGYPLAVSDDLELTCLPRRNDGFYGEAIFDEGHETRDLGFVVLSRRAVNDLDLHYVIQSASWSPLVSHVSSRTSLNVVSLWSPTSAPMRVWRWRPHHVSGATTSTWCICQPSLLQWLRSVGVLSELRRFQSLDA